MAIGPAGVAGDGCTPTQRAPTRSGTLRGRVPHPVDPYVRNAHPDRGDRGQQERRSHRYTRHATKASAVVDASPLGHRGAGELRTSRPWVAGAFSHRTGGSGWSPVAGRWLLFFSSPPARVGPTAVIGLLAAGADLAALGLCHGRTTSGGAGLGTLTDGRRQTADAPRGPDSGPLGVVSTSRGYMPVLPLPPPPPMPGMSRPASFVARNAP